ncbi:hypothetical protein, partial [Tenacibaculum finnmarkense]|uniref:hypothetical protein n=1 Tax=Tenacibaculum finnmarkense TaxID=2781243 RepID=UPI003BB61AA7
MNNYYLSGKNKFLLTCFFKFFLITFSFLMSSLVSAQCANGELTTEGYVTGSSATQVLGSPDNSNFYYSGNTPLVLEYTEEFIEGSVITFRGYYSQYNRPLTIEFGNSNSTFNAMTVVTPIFPNSMGEVTITVPIGAGIVTGAGYKWLRLVGEGWDGFNMTRIYLDAVKIATTNCNPCTAGLIKPILNPVPVATGQTVFNLNTYATVTNTGSKTLSWHSATPATTGNKIADVTTVSSGTYYAVFSGDNLGTPCFTDTTEFIIPCTVGAEAPSFLTNPTVSITGQATFDLSTFDATITNKGIKNVKWYYFLPASVDSEIPNGTQVLAGNYYAIFEGDNNGSPCYSDSTEFTIISDFDDDGIVDTIDIDDDNDGILDKFECTTDLTSSGSFEYDHTTVFESTRQFVGWSVKTANDGSSYTVHLEEQLPQDPVVNLVGKKDDWLFHDSVDWTEGQYINQSDNDANTKHPVIKKSTTDGGAFIIFSRGSEAISNNLTGLTIDQNYTFIYEMGLLPVYDDSGNANRYNPSTYVNITGGDILTTDNPDFSTYSMGDFPVSVTPSSSPLDPNWKVYRVVFKATSTSVNVKLGSGNTDAVITIDAVEVTRFPIDPICTRSLSTDADGDGCDDTVEAGLTALTPAQIAMGVGVNGLYDYLETSADSGILNDVIDTTKPYDPNVQGSACITCTNPDDSLIVNNPTVCKGSEASIIITNAEVGVTYQLRLDTDDSEVTGASATQLATGDLILKVTPGATTDYNIYATKGTCNIELINKVTVTVNTCTTTATDDNFSGKNTGNITGNVITGNNGNGVDADSDSAVTLAVASATVDANGNGTPTTLDLGIPTDIEISGIKIGTLTLSTNGDLVFVPESTYSGTLPTINYVLNGSTTANANVVIMVTSEEDVDGDGVSNSLDLDNDNDGVLDAEEDVNCTGNIVEEIIINETFEAGTVGAVIPKGSLVGVPGIDGLQEAYNSNSGNTSTTNVGDYKSITGVDGNLSIVIDANGGGIVDKEQMSSFIVLNKVNLLNGEKYTVESDFSLGLQYSGSTLAKESNEYGIAIGAPGQDPIWKEDYAGAPDGVFLYGHGSVLIREPNSSLPNFTAPPRVKGWFRQSATYYVKDNGSGILHLYADNKGYKYNAAGVLGAPFIANEIDLGAASNYPWLNNAAISVSTDEYVDNVVVKINHCDNDNDGIPNYLDTDSDNDGCPDAIEANENVTLAQLDADKRIDIANQGGVDINGVPNLVNSGGTADNSNNTQGQGTNTAVLTATKIEVKTQPTNKTICLGENAVFTAEMSSKSTTVFNAGVPDYTGIAGNTTGLVYQWEEQIEGAGSWNVISNGGIYSNATTASLKLTNPPVTASTNKYRLVITSTSNTCAEVISSEVEIVVNPTSVAGTIAGAGAVCTGTNSTELTLSGHTGTVVKWQSSTDNFVSSSDISNSTTTLTLTNLSVATKYRAVVKSGTCLEVTTAEVEIVVNPTSVAGTIAGAGAVCTGTNSTELTL